MGKFSNGDGQDRYASSSFPPQQCGILRRAMRPHESSKEPPHKSRTISLRDFLNPPARPVVLTCWASVQRSQDWRIFPQGHVPQRSRHVTTERGPILTPLGRAKACPAARGEVGVWLPPTRCHCPSPSRQARQSLRPTAKSAVSAGVSASLDSHTHDRSTQ